MKRVAFFRAINVGGHNKIPMAALRAALGEAGLSGIRTLIQTGNVVFESSLTDAEAEHLIREVSVAEFGVDTPVIIRSRTQIADALDVHPWAPGDFEPKFHQIHFLAAAPDSVLADRLSERAHTEDSP